MRRPGPKPVAQAASRLAPGPEAQRLVDCVQHLHTRGWCDGTSGNYSVTLSCDPLRLLITRSGIDKASIDRSDLLLIDTTGAPVDEGSGIPSAETPIHLTLARELGAGAVLHTHSVWGTLLGEHYLPQGGLTIGGYEMLKAFTGIETHATELFVPVVPNTQAMDELAAEVPKLAQRTPFYGFLIAGHGLYAWGDDLDEARRHVEAFEFLFRLAGRRTRFAPLDAANKKD